MKKGEELEGMGGGGGLFDVAGKCLKIANGGSVSKLTCKSLKGIGGWEIH